LEITRNKVWLVNPFAMPPKFEARIQTLKRAYYLKMNGYDVTIVSGSYLHNKGLNLIEDSSSYIERVYENQIKFLHIKNRSYNSNGLQRIISLLEFHFKLWWFVKKFEAPHFISHLAAVPFGNITYYTAKRVHAKFIVDVVDLWPESFVAYGLASKNNPFIRLSYLAERWLYAKADALIFSMEGGVEYIKEKDWCNKRILKVRLDKIFHINNGVDIDDFDNNKNKFTLEDEDLLSESTFKVIYLGSIRLANNLIQLIDAAASLKDFSDIKFFIYGDGDDRDYLERYCKKKQINNVVFKDRWIELKYVPYVLSKSSLNILNYMPSALFRFGASQSKSFQYMASGRPICSNVKMNFCPITKYQIGISDSFSNSKSYADAILSFYTMEKSSYDSMCNRSRNAALNYDYKVLALKFIDVMNKIT
jgi:glycosyltransferase involved in cell wall biosynthesis